MSELKQYRCEKCRDTGMIHYDEVLGTMLEMHSYPCSCEAGKKILNAKTTNSARNFEAEEAWGRLQNAERKIRELEEENARMREALQEIAREHDSYNIKWAKKIASRTLEMLKGGE